MIHKFKVGDLVEYYPLEEFPVGDGGYQSYPTSKPAQAIITGFYDNETGTKLSGDFTTMDKVIEVSVAGSAGIDRLFMSEIELVSSVEYDPLC